MIRGAASVLAGQLLVRIERGDQKSLSSASVRVSIERICPRLAVRFCPQEQIDVFFAWRTDKALIQ